MPLRIRKPKDTPAEEEQTKCLSCFKRPQEFKSTWIEGEMICRRCYDVERSKPYVQAQLKLGVPLKDIGFTNRRMHDGF